MTLKQLCLSFKGRINRRIYWFCVAGITVVILASWAFMDFLEGEPTRTRGRRYSSPNLTEIIVFFVIPTLSSLFVGLAVTVKRLHDINRSGVHALIALVPIIGLVYLLIVCGFLKGTDGENAYGPPVDKIT